MPCILIGIFSDCGLKFGFLNFPKKCSDFLILGRREGVKKAPDTLFLMVSLMDAIFYDWLFSLNWLKMIWC